jgi:glycosyltransferase involved in cell wall biosynthesis
MTEETTISIIIPAYNEANAIGDTLKKVTALADIDEIIVVDDGSKDATADIVSSFETVRLVQHPYNLGNGAAVKSGIRAATGDWVLMMDAEGQHPPEEVLNLLQYRHQFEMVVGARDKTSSTSFHRRMANQFFNYYATYVLGHSVPDLTSGFRLLRRGTALKFIYLLPNGYSYPTTLTISLSRAGFPIKFHPFQSPARQTGKSGIKPLTDGIRFLMKITQLAVYFVPMKIFLPLAIIFLVPGITYTLVLLIVESRFSGFGGLMTTIGLLIFLLGLISEQIANIRFMFAES